MESSWRNHSGRTPVSASFPDWAGNQMSPRHWCAICEISLGCDYTIWKTCVNDRNPHILFCCFGRSGLRPFLVRGDSPATPPSKTTPHRPFVLITAVRPNQSCGCQPNTQPDNLNGGEDEGPAKTDTVCRIVTTGKQKASLSSPELHERDASFQFSFQTCGGTVFQFHLTLNRVSHEGDCPHYRKVSQASSPARW